MRKKKRAFFMVFFAAYLVAGGALAAAFSCAARAADETDVGEMEVQVLPPSAKENTQIVPGLSFKNGPFPLALIDPFGASPKLAVTVEGSYSNLEWSLIVLPGGKVIPRSKMSGSFRVRVPISQPRTVLTFTAVGPGGSLLHTQMVLESHDWNDVQKRIEQAKIPRRFHWSLGAGVTHLDYTQGGVPDISSVLISTKAGVEYWITPDRWDLSLSGYFTPVPLSTTPAGYSILFLGLNARAGYVFPFVASPWRLTLMAGFYYATTFTSSTDGTQFGYANIGGPELYPTLSRTFRSGSSLGAYFKLSPVSDQFTVLSLSNREIASGLSYHFPPDRSRRNFSLDFDWANLVVHAANTQASSTTLSLSGGYRW